MLCSLALLFVLHFLTSKVLANTESFFLKVPRDFPVTTGSAYDIVDQFPLAISLNNSNNAKITLEKVISNDVRPTYIELRNLQVDETYQVKICWTALDPVAIEKMNWFVVPHSTSFEDSISEYARIFIEFTVRNDSYPVLKAGTIVPINVSVINSKLGIPVDLYKTILYIILVMACVGILNRRINIYGLIKT